MLPPPCQWYDGTDGCYLDWNRICVGWVKPAAGRFETMIQWQGKRHAGTAGSVAQGKRFIERWVSAQTGGPREPQRHWYDRPRPVGEMFQHVSGLDD